MVQLSGGDTSAATAADDRPLSPGERTRLCVALASHILPPQADLTPALDVVGEDNAKLQAIVRSHFSQLSTLEQIETLQLVLSLCKSEKELTAAKHLKAVFRAWLGEVTRLHDKPQNIAADIRLLNCCLKDLGLSRHSGRRLLVRLGRWSALYHAQSLDLAQLAVLQHLLRGDFADGVLVANALTPSALRILMQDFALSGMRITNSTVVESAVSAIISATDHRCHADGPMMATFAPFPSLRPFIKARPPIQEKVRRHRTVEKQCTTGGAPDFINGLDVNNAVKLDTEVEIVQVSSSSPSIRPTSSDTSSAVTPIFPATGAHAVSAAVATRKGGKKKEQNGSDGSAKCIVTPPIERQETAEDIDMTPPAWDLKVRVIKAFPPNYTSPEVSKRWCMLPCSVGEDHLARIVPATVEWLWLYRKHYPGSRYTVGGWYPAAYVSILETNSKSKLAARLTGGCLSKEHGPLYVEMRAVDEETIRGGKSPRVIASPTVLVEPADPVASGQPLNTHEGSSSTSCVVTDPLVATIESFMQLGLTEAQNKFLDIIGLLTELCPSAESELSATIMAVVDASTMEELKPFLLALKRSVAGTTASQRPSSESSMAESIANCLHKYATIIRVSVLPKFCPT